ncbi:MAG: class I fumarate hydratase [Calditrichia bacterium]
MDSLAKSMAELIIKTSTELATDVAETIAMNQMKEEAGSRAAAAMSTIGRNILMAKQNTGPICQDTGMPTFEIKTPVGYNQIQLKKAIDEALVYATKEGKLRPNAVDSITGKNSGNNLGAGVPVLHFDQWEKDDIEVRLILKGGGCENKSAQYTLPSEFPGLGRANRDLDGIRKAILYALWQAQGQGCSSGFIGVGVGGDRTSSYHLAKLQLFRDLRDTNPDPALAKLEEYILEAGNQLDIGPMGFGGKSTVLGCKIGAYHRLPASFYVSVAYNCWAFRRLGVILDAKSGEIKEWLYRDKEVDIQGEGIKITGKEKVIQLPADEATIRDLKVGDVVLLNGPMHTGRDALHKYLIDEDSPVDLNGHVIYHCGPIMLQENGGWRVVAAGPTTSIREEPYQADVLKKFNVRGVIGKGGMGKKTLEGLREVGAVYFHAIGGAAQYYADSIKKVTGVHFLEEFGVPEAMWHLEVENFPVIVTMDAHGNSLHDEVAEKSRKNLEAFAEKVF